MPLIICPDCAKQFSDAAAACPNCGRPNRAANPPPEPKKKSFATGCAGIGCLSLIVLYFIGSMASGPDSSSSVRQSGSPSSRPAPAVSAPVLELQSWSWHIEYDYAIAEGTVKNISSTSLKNVQAIVTFHDKAGGFITSDDALIEYDPILPGQTSPFKVMARHNPAMKNAGIDFKQLMGGTLQWRERERKK